MFFNLGHVWLQPNRKHILGDQKHVLTPFLVASFHLTRYYQTSRLFFKLFTKSVSKGRVFTILFFVFFLGLQPSWGQDTVPSSASSPLDANKAVPYAQAGTPMRFRWMEGEGPNGAKQWISAVGFVSEGTAGEFNRFAATHIVKDQWLALDSTGGSTGEAMRLGRLLRTQGIKTIVGRSVPTQNTRQMAFTTRDGRCSSACVLLFMGGKERFVAPETYIGAHLFSVAVDSNGNRVREELIMRDIENAQKMMADHAVFLEEMGVSARYLKLMGEARFKNDMRRLTSEEIKTTKLAAILNTSDANKQLKKIENTTNWTLDLAGSSPSMRKLPKSKDTQKNYEVTLSCANVKGFIRFTYQINTMKNDGSFLTLQEMGLPSARLETGAGWNYLINPTPEIVAQWQADSAEINGKQKVKEMIMRRDIPLKVFEDAMKNEELDLFTKYYRVKISLTSINPSQDDFESEKKLSTMQQTGEKLGLYDPFFAYNFQSLHHHCMKIPHLMSIGLPPRH